MPLPLEATTATDAVLSLHIGDKVGWSTGERLGVWKLPNTPDHGYLGAALVDALSDHCKLSRPTLITLSGPPYEAESPMSADAAVLHLGLLMCVRLVAFRRKIRMEVPSITKVREKMLGKSEFNRSGLKDSVMSFARRRGHDKLDIDASHALVLWSYSSEMVAGK